ncbi:MAG TPA: hypothetical protein VFD85_12630 [Gemmatimonadales bacterium]|nr:hypothetical protein [Gemmatimonadales bacterium]HZH41854.1 hypothetical protein [Gemmatimonadales bacterium]
MWRPAILPALLLLAACVPSRRYAPSPCTPTIEPIKNTAIILVINITYTYTPEDESGARESHKEEVLDELNSLGRNDGNTFAEPNGQDNNFTFTYSISNDGQDHYTGGLRFAGWGQGFIHQFNRYDNTYASTEQLVRDLTDDAYGFIRDGWHDARPACSQSR